MSSPVFGRYLLLKSLGSGAMGDVQLARPLDEGSGLPSPIVVKRLHPELAKIPDFVRRFRHEAEVATQVDSPHLAKVFDVGNVGGVLYMAIEYVEGWPLSKLFTELVEVGAHPNVAAVVEIVLGALEGLAALHEARDAHGAALEIVHRDIAPKNIMLGEDGIPRLIDLGIGRSNLKDWVTRTGAVMGTPGYMAPEQALGRLVDHRADLYSMAVVFFDLLTLQPFIPRGTVPFMLRASAAPVFRAPSSLRADLPRGIDAVFERAMRLAPEDRFQSARELLEAIRGLSLANVEIHSAHSLITDLLRLEFERSKTELSLLLIESASTSDETQVMEPHEVFALRKDVRRSRPPLSAPKRPPTLPQRPSEPERRRSDPLPRASPTHRGLWTGIAIGLIPFFLLLGLWVDRRPAEELPRDLPREVEERTAEVTALPAAEPGLSDPPLGAPGSPQRVEPTPPKRNRSTKVVAAQDPTAEPPILDSAIAKPAAGASVGAVPGTWPTLPAIGDARRRVFDLQSRADRLKPRFKPGSEGADRLTKMRADLMSLAKKRELGQDEVDRWESQILELERMVP